MPGRPHGSGSEGKDASHNSSRASNQLDVHSGGTSMPGHGPMEGAGRGLRVQPLTEALGSSQPQGKT